VLSARDGGPRWRWLAALPETLDPPPEVAATMGDGVAAE
jgi:hypothetical protein